VNITTHAERTIESKGIALEDVEAVWHDPDLVYPSNRYPGQHKRIGRGIVLCCEDSTGKVITVFVNMTNTPLRPDQRRDADALAWAKKNGMVA
jgi:uncharacterized DUF497 family protein